VPHPCYLDLISGVYSKTAHIPQHCTVHLTPNLIMWHRWKTKSINTSTVSSSIY